MLDACQNPTRGWLMAFTIVSSVRGQIIPIGQFSQYYSVFPDSAINMAGFSYNVNFDTPRGNLTYIQQLCYEHPTCVSFDYEISTLVGVGWLHRISKDCAMSAGAQFTDGESTGTYYFQLKDNVLADKGINASYCVRVKQPYVPDYKTGEMITRLFAAAVGTFVLVGMTLYASLFVIKRRERSRLIANVINDEEGMEDDDIPMMAANPPRQRPRPRPVPQQQ